MVAWHLPACSAAVLKPALHVSVPVQLRVPGLQLRDRVGEYIASWPLTSVCQNSICQMELIAKSCYVDTIHCTASRPQMTVFL